MLLLPFYLRPKCLTRICLISWLLDGTDYLDKLRGDDGTCSSVLANECIGDLEEAARSRNPGSTCSCPHASSAPSCAALDNDSALWGPTCSGTFFDAPGIRTWEEGEWDTSVYGGVTPHGPGNVTDYNYIGSLARPVMVSISNGSYTETTLSCVRAKDATGGSTAPEG